MLRVVTHRRWIAQELGSNTLGVQVVHDYGFDAPAAGVDQAFWCPTEWACRAGLRLSSPGPGWLPSLSPRCLGRTVSAVAVGLLGQAGTTFTGPVFAKVAEAKPERFPAAVRTGLTQVLADAAAAGLPGDSMLHLSDPVSFEVEVRCFVLGGRVVASSPYLMDGHVWQDGMVAAPAVLQEAVGFAGDVAAAHDGPAGYVLDVGLCAAGWLVVEANPAWSSAFYGADIDAVVETVLAANRDDADWRWAPDAWLAGRSRPLAEPGVLRGR